MKNKNNPVFKPRLQPSKETNITGVVRGEKVGTVELNDKEKAEKKIADIANKLEGKVITSETTGTPLPVGYDPDLPIGKQREFIGLV